MLSVVEGRRMPLLSMRKSGRKGAERARQGMAWRKKGVLGSSLCSTDRLTRGAPNLAKNLMCCALRCAFTRACWLLRVGSLGRTRTAATRLGCCDLASRGSKAGGVVCGQGIWKCRSAHSNQHDFAFHISVAAHQDYNSGIRYSRLHWATSSEGTWRGASQPRNPVNAIGSFSISSSPPPNS